MDVGFDAYADLRERSRVFRDGLRRRTEAVDALLAAAVGTRPVRVLDIGTADGRMLEHLSQRFPSSTFVGLEAREDMVAVARQRGLHVVCARAETLPFEEAHFDAVTVISTLKHVPEASAVLRECRRVLTPDGHLVVSDPTPFGIRLGLWRKHFERQYLPNIWTLDDTARHLREAGFEIRRAYRYMLLPISIRGSRTLERLLRGVGCSRAFMQQILLAQRTGSAGQP